MNGGEGMNGGAVSPEGSPGVSPEASRDPAPAPSAAPSPSRYVARWDLDKTYLRTDFDTLRDLVRTAIERPDQKRTVPGAASLLRELGRAGVEIHILSGSPEQLRSRIEQKLRLDGARWESLTLKPNLQNLLRLRFRALRGQLDYKLTSLLSRRSELGDLGAQRGSPARSPQASTKDLGPQRGSPAQSLQASTTGSGPQRGSVAIPGAPARGQRNEDGSLVREVLLGDDAEADAFVYSLYADVCEGNVPASVLEEILRRGRSYEDTIERALELMDRVEKGPVVERILIHLERQSSPADFRVFGDRVVPFYNYLQAAFVLHEDGRLPARAVLRVAQDLVVAHNFESGALARSYLDLSRRGHVSGRGIGDLAEGYRELTARRTAGASELGAMIDELDRMRGDLRPPLHRPRPPIDYLGLVRSHNRRSKDRR